jgi:hypothetical protein
MPDPYMEPPGREIAVLAGCVLLVVGMLFAGRLRPAKAWAGVTEGELQEVVAVVRSEPKFSAVRWDISPEGRILLFVPRETGPSSRAELEELVTRVIPDYPPVVRWEERAPVASAF